MIMTVQEGLERYKVVLKQYKKFTDRLIKKYDGIYGKGNWNPLGNFLNNDYSELTVFNARLKAMIDALGLTEKEVAAIDKECGCGITSTGERAAA